MEARERIRKLLVLGDNRVKQGDARIYPKARANYEEALALARDEGLADTIAPLVELRLAELDRLAKEAKPSSSA